MVNGDSGKVAPPKTPGDCGGTLGDDIAADFDRALRLAADAGRWETVDLLLREREQRRRDAAGVVPLDVARRRGRS